MENKVKLPREVAEELSAIKQHESYPIRLVIDIFNGVATGEPGALHKYFETDRSRRIEIIMKALINGYEIKETPEQRICDFYHTKASCDMHPHQAIKHVLNILEIKVKGVNDNE